MNLKFPGTKLNSFLASTVVAGFLVFTAQVSNGAPREVRVEVADPPDVVGQWLAPEPWPVISIHAAVLPTGRVLHYSYPWATPGSLAKLWDPVTGSFTDVSMNTDIFCGGLSFLADGRLYVTGGNDYGCEFQGRQDTHTFNPFTGRWRRLEDMSVGRWYPTNLSLGDGSTMIFSGLGRDCETTPVVELFDPAAGLQVVPEAERFMALYPWLHLLSSGRIAHVGPQASTEIFDPVSGTWEPVGSRRRDRWDGTSFLVPRETDAVMACGGSDRRVTRTCQRIDFSEPSPEWRRTTPMSFARSHANAVILPDGSVMIVGGGMDDLYGDPVANPELYDPVSDTWTLLPPQFFGRMYHSTAVLLPDGRVLSAGQDDGESGFWGEIYEPAYLFRGPRPVIQEISGRMSYGTSILIRTPQARDIASVVLVRLSTVTHSVNNGQRYVDLEFRTLGPNRVLAGAPAGGNHAPPGHYMLFIVDSDGVPSVARIIRLGTLANNRGVFESGAAPTSPSERGR